MDMAGVGNCYLYSQNKESQCFLLGTTSKRGIGGSNPFVDVSKQRCKPLFSRVCSVFNFATRLRQNHLLLVEGY